MKTGWQIKKLGEVCELYQPKTISKKDMIPSGEYPVFGANGQIGYFNQYNHEDSELLITCRGATCGAVNFSKPRSWINGNAMVVRPRDEKLDKQYLGHLFGGAVSLSSVITGAAQPQITRQSLSPVEIPIPPLAEQQQIVAALDAAFEGIAKAKAHAEQNLKSARELFESRLNHLFTHPGDDWVEKRLVDITSKLGDGLHGTPEYTDDGDYYFINGNNLNDGFIRYKEQTKRVSFAEYTKHKKELNNRTVLVSINGTLGNVAFYNNENIILGKSACYFNLNENVDKNYIKHLISSPYFIEYAHKEATGATIKNVSLKTMRNFMVPLPPLPEQQRIVTELDALAAQTKRLEAIYQQKLALLDELKQSILQKAFAGELVTDKLAA